MSADMRGLNDRTVLVTGGANGIGAAIARRLAEEGIVVRPIREVLAERRGFSSDRAGKGKSLQDNSVK